jgi:hypothetical protein
MAAELLINERHVLDERAFVEIVIRRVPASVPGSAHEFKYRLAFVVDEICVLRYDNEAGKGDHRHVGDNGVRISLRHMTRFWRTSGKTYNRGDHDEDSYVRGVFG